MKHFKLFFACLLMAVLSIGQVWAAEGDVVYTLNTAADEIPIATSNSYDSYADATNNWKITCGAKQSDGLWLGSNSNKKAKMILSNGSYTEGSAIATAIGVQASSTYYAAIIGTSELENVGKVTLTYSATGGTAPSEAWICYSTDDGSTWSIAKKVTTLSTSGTDFEFDETIESARYAFVIHCTGYCQFKVPVLTFYEGATASPSYTIGAQSNNTNYGTVSLSGSVITGSPKAGYRYANPAYSVSPANSATVAQDGNAFTVTPSANTTVTINFEAIPTHTVTWSKNGSTSSENYAEGAAISFPASASGCDGKTFVGWSASTINGETDDAPSIVTSATMGNSNITYYAVFAEVGASSGATVNTVMWGEDFTTKTVYNEATVSYTYNDGGSATKTYNETLAGGSSPELLVGKTSGSFVIEGIPVGGAATLTLSYRMNNTNISAATTTTENVSISDRSGSNPYTQTITINGNVSTFDLIFANTNGSNGRIDNISVVVASQASSYSNYATSCCQKYAVNIANNIQNGTITANPTSACEGATVTLSATPATGYQFSAWSVKKANDVVVEVTNNAFTMPSEAVTVSATFAAKHHDVVFHKNAGDNPEVTTKQDFAYGQTQNLTDNAWSRGEDYSFNGWNTLPTGLGTPYSDGASFTLNVDANVDLYAQWLENTSHAVSYSGDAHIASYSVKPIKIAEDAEELTAEFALETGYKVTAVAATINGVPVDAGNIDFDQTMVYITSTGFAGDVVITFTIEEIIYTVTFDKGTGVCATASMPQASYNANIELPAATPSVACQDEEYGWSFAGWKVGSAVASETSAAQTLLAAGSNYKPESDVTLYAVYKRSEAGVGTSEKTASVTISEYATAHSWVNGTQYTSITFDENITANTSTAGNTAKYYTSGNDWRFYQGDKSTLTLNAANSCTLKSATFTYSVSNTGVLMDGDDQVATGEEYEISGTPTSKEFSVGNTGSAANGQVKFTVISVTYNKPADATIYYHSTPSCAQKYTITVDGEIANGSVAVSPNVAKATAGTALTLTATPVENVSRFKQWDVTGMELSNEQKATSPLNIEMPASNLTVSATFDALYAITPELVNGTFDLDKNYAIEGETVTVSNIAANEQYKDPVLKVYYVENEVETVIEHTNGVFTMPAHAVTVQVTCSPALVALAAPALTATPTYQGVSFTWTSVEGNEGYVLTIEGFDPVVIDKDATSYEKATGLTANTAYNYSIYTKGNGTTTLAVNTPAESSFTTSDYPAATLSLQENGGEAYVWGSNLKVNDVIKLPEELDGLGCTGKVLVGWSSVAVAETDDEPTSNYWAKGANYTIASTADKLYAVLATTVDGDVTISSTPLTSAPEQGAKYVIGANHKTSGIKYFSSYSEIGSNLNWGTMDASTTIYFTLSGTTSALAAYDGSAYLKNRPGGFEMSTSSTTIALQADGAIRGSSEETATRLRYNSDQETFGLRWYASDKSTGNPAYFYKVEQEVSYEGYTTSCEAQLPKLDAPVFGGIEEGVYYEAQNDITLSAADGATIYFVIDEEEITEQNRAEYTVGAISLSDYGVHTVKAIAVKEGYEASDVATATYAIGKEFASVSDLYSYLEANSLTSMNNVKVTGLVSRITTAWDGEKGYLTYYISDNGVAENDLQMYRGAGEGASALAVGDQVTVIGNYLYYTGGSTPTHEFGAGNTIVARTAAELASVAIGGELEKKNYSPEDNVFNRTGLTATATYNTGYTKDVTALATWTNNLTNNIVAASGNVEVTATYGEKSDTKQVAVTYTSKTLDHITLSYSSTTVYVGMALPTPTVTASYVEDIEDEDVTALVAAANGFDTESAYDGTAAGSYTINVSYTLGEVTRSAEYTVTVIAVFGNEENPHAASAAKAMIEARPDNTESSTTEFMWVRGIVSQASTPSSSKQNYYISDDGETTNQLYVYQGQYFSTSPSINATNQLQVGDEVVVKARVQLYKNNQNVLIPELKSTNVTSHFRMPAFAFDDIVAADEFEAEYSTNVTIVPTENTNDAAFTLESSDEAIVKVVDGNKLSAIAEGDAVITATRDAVGEAGELNYKAKSVDFNVHVIAARTRFTVTFDAGEAGDNVSGDAPETIAAQLEGAPVELPECTYTWTHHGFTGWKVINLSTEAEVEVENNQFTMPAANVKIQAQWKEIATTHIVFNVNGNTETVAAVDVPQEVEYSITQVTDGQNGYEFFGWAESPETEDVEEAIATIESYTPGAGEASKTLYAVFKRVDEGAPKTDVLTAADFTATSTTYTDFSNISKTSNAKYAGNSAKDDGSIQLRSKNSNSGIVTTYTGGILKSVKITVANGSNTLDVYGSNTAYTAASDLYGSAVTQGTKIGSTSTTNTINAAADYNYVGIRSNSGAIYLSSVEITWQPKTTYYTTAPSAVYAVSYVLGEGGAWEGDACDGANVKAGKTFDICESVPVREHYKFVKWQVAGEDVSGTITINAETEITAVWEAKVESNVTYNAGTGTGSDVVVSNVEEGTEVTLKAIGSGEGQANFTKSGYDFKGWKYNGKTYKAGATIEMPAEAITLTAQWKKQNVEKLSLIKDASQLMNGMNVVIANQEAGTVAGASEAESNSFLASETGIFNTDKSQITNIGNGIKMTLTQLESGWALKYNNKYLKEYSGNKICWVNDPIAWQITVGSDSTKIERTVGNNSYAIRFNSANNAQRFAAYGLSSVHPIQLYGELTVVSGTTNISDYGYVEGDVIVLSNNATLTVDEDIAPTTMIVPAGTTVTVNDEKKIDANTLIVERGGTLDIQTNGTVNTDETFVIYSTLGKGTGTTASGNNAPGSSSQIKNANKIAASGNVFFELELTQDATATEGWYAFSVPFPVDVMNGVYYKDTKLENEVGYAIMSYHGNLRANGEYGWKKYREPNLVPGMLYIITVGDTDYKTLRFKKTENGALEASNTVTLNKYASQTGEAKDGGWNGIGNPNMQISNYVTGGGSPTGAFIQFLDHNANAFKNRQRNNVNLVVGSAFFFQYTGENEQTSITINKSALEGDNNGYLAPKREHNVVEETIYEVELTNVATEEVEDNIFLTAREDALNEYEIGRDLAKLSMGTAKCAQMWVPAYGTNLCAADFQLVNNKATYPLIINAPSAGTYTISTTANENATLYLTKNGRIYWNLTMGACELELNQGQNNEYGLVLRAEVPAVTTGIENGELLNGENGVQKVVIDEHVYILRGGQMYDMTGKMVK